MGNKKVINKLNRFLIEHDTKIILVFLLVIFLAFAFFIARNLAPGIIPDEPAHVVFSKYYSTTLGIPGDITETYSLGWYIEQNPFLYYWINGRMINLVDLVFDSLTDWQYLVILRFVNVFYGFGTAVFCFLLSKILIKHKWWQLLPVFLLTNTLMFVFLTGGVNYDNLANLFSMAGIYFLVRVLDGKPFLPNTMAWMINISAGTLVKYPILPLALTSGVIWIIYLARKRTQIFPIKLNIKQIVPLSVILVALLFGNIAIYGRNLVRFQSIVPNCVEILTEDQCELSPYVERHNELALSQSLTITDSIRLGYPDPLTYLIDSWIPNMFYRVYGILAHQSYFPPQIIILFRLLFYWMILLIFKYWRQPSFKIMVLGFIFLFYALVLFVINYNSELVYGFKQIAMQGRYIFPVIGIAYAFYAYFLEKVPHKIIRNMTLIATLGIFLISGPIRLIIDYGTIFTYWFIR